MNQDAHDDAAHDESHSQDPRPAEPDEHRIRLRAYEIWEEEGRPDGRADDHWTMARKELERELDPKEERLRLKVGMGPGSGAR